MLIRIEIFDRIIHIEIAKQQYETLETLEPVPENAALPLAVFVDEPTDPVASRLYF
jgi:hypothetical protein